MGAAEFRRDFESGDIDAVLADFAPGFQLFHAGQAVPSSDPGVLGMTLQAVRELFGDGFRFSDCVPATAHGERYMLLPWTAVVGGIEAEGVDLVKEEASGRLLEVRITMRPLSGIQALSDGMTSRMGGFHAAHPPGSGDQ
jgi:hypothetical protein